MKKFLLILICFYSQLMFADDVQIKLIALFESKAMLSVNGRNKTLKQGESFSGVKLLVVNTQQATIEVNGEQQILELGIGILSSPIADQVQQKAKDSITLWADDSGFFFANGSVGKSSARFLIDTGANVVALSSVAADSLGLSYQNAPKSIVVTASGQAPAYDIVIKKLSIEGVVLYNIQASIIVGDYPKVPLLGMSFLGKLDMQRIGKKMELKKRF